MSSLIPGTAVITGASTGIGAVYADRLARRGHDLILIARNRSLLGSLAKKIARDTGRSVRVIAADLTKKEDLAGVESTLSSDPGITVLVNNAGALSASPLLGSNVDEMEKMIALNITALTRLTYAVVPHLVARGAGAVINIASIVAVAPDLLNGVYGASKAYVLSFSQSLQHELQGKGVAVQAVLPGPTRTPLWHPTGVDIDQAMKGHVMSPEDLVDASLAGFDAGEFATLPTLGDVEKWNQFESARLALKPHLAGERPAPRYKLSA
ncbi:MAG: SDR family oxidoreductase [Steroidobacteraceae bacterium]|jgi:short-subunit dehydrogenase